MRTKIGVAVWGTGNMGSTSIRSVTAFPGLRLTGVITSSEAKAGTDAAMFAGLDADTGITATADGPGLSAVLAQCDAVAYMASGDIRPEEAIADIERCLRAGVHVVTPSLTRSTTRAPHHRSGWSGSPRPPRRAGWRCSSAGSTRAGATMRSR